MCLAEGDTIGILAHLDVDVEIEEAEVAHVEHLFHLHLERLHFSFLHAGDYEVVDVVSRWILALGVSRILALIERIAHRVGAIFWVYFSHNAMPT